MPYGNHLIHPRLFERLERTFWRHTVTIQSRDFTMRDNIGGIENDETLNPWATLTGHEHIVCNKGRSTDNSKGITSETRERHSTFDGKIFQCMLNGLYPLITEQMRATIDGEPYNIRGVVHDSSKNLTGLVVEIIA
jgi:hypothetical protein